MDSEVLTRPKCAAESHFVCVFWGLKRLVTTNVVILRKYLYPCMDMPGAMYCHSRSRT